MALSKNKQMVADKFITVLSNLDEKSEGDQKILQGMNMFLGGCIRSAELAAEGAATGGDEPSFEEAGDETATSEEEVAFGDVEEGGDEPSFDDGAEEGGEEVAFGDEAAEGDEPSFDDGTEEAATDDEPSFEDDPAPAKPARTAKAAPAEPEDPFAKMGVQEIIDLLKNAGVDMEKVKAAHKAEKKDGLVKLARQIDALSASWVKYLTKATVEQAEKVAAGKGVTVKYPRGRSDDTKKKGLIADALAAKFIAIPVKK